MSCSDEHGMMGRNLDGKTMAFSSLQLTGFPGDILSAKIVSMWVLLKVGVGLRAKWRHGKTEVYKKESSLGGLGPSWTGSHMAALCPQLPLELAKRDRAWEEPDPTPQLLAG